MNRILVKHDKIVDTNLIDVDNNCVTFNKSGDYIVEYVNCCNINLEINVCDNIDVNLFVVNCDNDINIDIKYNLNENSKVNVNKFYHNDRVSENLFINLNGINSCINYKFSGISKGIEIYNMQINHNNSNTKSYVCNRLIANVDSKIEFNIDSKVLKNSCNCNTNQDSKIITIGDNKSIIKPNMYIDNYDVEARHSSVVGQFRDEDIFYMLSRGIDENTAFKLLVKGYMFSNIDKNMFMRAYILNVINGYWR